MKELPVIAPIAQKLRFEGEETIIGIDLGTTNSLVAMTEQGIPKIIPTRERANLLPSVVRFLKDGTHQVGLAAREARSVDPKNTVFSVKRLLGRGANDLSEIDVPFELDASSESIIKILVQGRSYTAIEISAMILEELKNSATMYLGHPVKNAVITVPAYFNDSQRHATRMAGLLAGLNVLRILNEPTAASLAYGLQKKKNGLIAVYDLGGGTFDISILKLENGIFEVLATNGDTALGGDDMDRAIAKYLSEQKLSTNVDNAFVVHVAEQLKIALTSSERSEFSGFSLDRITMEKLVSPVVEKTRKPVLAALKDAGFNPDQLTDVVLVGGPTRMPVVRAFVEQLFGRTSNSSLNPDEVVALGAAIQADILAGNNRDFLLLDVVPLSLGIETFGGAMSSLIERNTRIPALAKEQFTTYVDGQTKVAINVFQGERLLVKDNRKLAEFILHGVPPMPAGLARVEVMFLVDADGILNVSAREIHSGVEQSIEVRPTYGLSDTELEAMLASGLAHAANDAQARALIDAKNEARTILLATERSLPEGRRLLDTAEIEQVEELIARMHSALDSNNLEAILSAKKLLNAGTEALARVLNE